MLAAAVETEPGEEPLLPLTLESQRLWPGFARELLAATGVSVEYRDEGTLVVALNRDDAETLRHSYDFQKGLGLDIAWLNATEARRLEPHLKPGQCLIDTSTSSVALTREIGERLVEIGSHPDAFARSGSAGDGLDGHDFHYRAILFGNDDRRSEHHFLNDLREVGFGIDQFVGFRHGHII